MSASQRVGRATLNFDDAIGLRPRARSLVASVLRVAAVLAVTLLLIVGLFVESKPPGLRAQETTDGATGGGSATSKEIEPRETIFTLIVKGGWIMVPIGLCSVLVATVAIERVISMRTSRAGTPGLVDEIVALVPTRGDVAGGKRDEALALCRRAGVVDRVIRAGVEKLHREEGPVVEALEEAAGREAHKLRRKLRPLAMVAALSPLLGLLGTIYGMITCFENAVAADTASRAATLASGIYVALVSTAAGMSVAIPAMLLNFYFQGRVDRITDHVDESATNLVDHYYGVPAPADGNTLSLKRGRAARLEDRSAQAGS